MIVLDDSLDACLRCLTLLLVNGSEEKSATKENKENLLPELQEKTLDP